MKIYSDFPVRRTLQIVADVVAVALIALGVWLGVATTASITSLAEVGRQLESAGADFKGAMVGAGEALGQVPFVGDAIRGPFDAASGTGSALEDAGQTTEAFIESTAMIIGVAIAVVIVVTVSWLWLRRRYRFARRATEVQKLAGFEGGADVLALRALVNGSRKDLALASLNPAEAWRLGDRAVVARLAELELREAGVRLAR